MEKLTSPLPLLPIGEECFVYKCGQKQSYSNQPFPFQRKKSNIIAPDYLLSFLYCVLFSYFMIQNTYFYIKAKSIRSRKGLTLKKKVLGCHTHVIFYLGVKSKVKLCRKKLSKGLVLKLSQTSSLVP